MCRLKINHVLGELKHVFIRGSVIYVVVLIFELRQLFIYIYMSSYVTY
jgi:hypothetical protein